MVWEILINNISWTLKKQEIYRKLEDLVSFWNLQIKIKITPIITYYDLLKDKYKIYKESKNKAVIYRWINCINNKSYIGSTKCLKSRFNVYFSLSKMKKNLDTGNSLIYMALLKYGYSNFKLEIIEYCKPHLLISREQYYLDRLKPEYNICKIAGSTLGKLHSDYTKKKIGDSIRGEKHPMFGKHYNLEIRKHMGESKISNKHLIIHKMQAETKIKLSLRSIGMKIKVYDSTNTFIAEFPTINSTAKYFNVSSSTIKRALRLNISYQNFKFKSEIIDNRIWVYDLNYKLIEVLDNRVKTSKSFNIPTTTLSRYIDSGKLWKESYYFTASRIKNKD